MSLLSFVIPCYRSEKTIEMVIDEIIATVAQKASYDYEIICVNDCSPDCVYGVLTSLAEKNHKIKVLNLARNMGKHAAMLAGYSVAKGDFIVNLDDDYQCPVYELWRLLEPLEHEDYDMVTAVYKEKKESALKRLGSKINNEMAHLMIQQPTGLRMENFSVMKRFVMDELVKYTNPYPYVGGLILRVTNRIKMVLVEERERGDDNTSGFTLGKSISLFLNGFTAFSVLPLRIAAFSGFLFSSLGFLLCIYFVIRKILHPEILLGYSSIVSIILFTSGIVMLILGMLGEYVGRIYICMNQAAPYVIRDKINVD